VTDERTNQPIDPDDRFAVAAAADAAARGNRPRLLVLLAGVVVAASTLFLLTAFTSYRAAKGELEAGRAQLERVRELAVEHRRWQLAAEAGAGGEIVCDPNPALISTIRNKAIALGLDPDLPDDRSEERGGIRERTLQYELTSTSLEDLLTFVERVRDDIGCMSVYKLDLTPRRTAWEMEVGFKRLVRAQ